MNEVAVDWTENETWDSFGAEAGVQAGDYGNFLGSALGIPPVVTPRCDGQHRGLGGIIAANRGWIFRPTDTNGVDFRSSEYATLAARPRLEITYRTSPLEPVVKLQFEEDEGSGSTAFDTAPLLGDNDGLLSDPGMWNNNDPDRGRVIVLDGAVDRVAVDPAPLMMDTWSQFTVAAWVRNDIGAGAGTDDIISWWNYTTGSNSWLLTHHSNNEYFFQIGDTFISGGAVSTAWTYVAATYDGSDTRLYVNGSEVASAAYNAGIPSSTGSVMIGTQDDLSNFFDGAIDDVEIFNEALSPQEIMTRYSSTSACYTLTLGHSGQGSDPVATPTSSAGCSAGEYVAGALIQLSGAVPVADWQIDGWNGTGNDASTADTNTVTMPAAAHSAGVIYVESTTPPPSGGVTEDFNLYTAGSTIGTYPGWFVDGDGPVVTDGIGCGGSTGLASSGTIFTWTDHPFDWTDPDFVGVRLWGSFKTNDTGLLDDDRVGWMTTDSNSSSDNIFGVQVDPESGAMRLEAYFDGTGTADQRPVIDETASLKPDTWYRLYTEIIKLTPTSATISATLTELDDNCTPVAVVLEGTIADTDDVVALGTEAPDTKYFTGPIWPAYKNHTTAAAPADEFGFEVLTNVRFAAIGDYGSNTSDELDVANLVNTFSPGFIVTTGDNSYGSDAPVVPAVSTIDQNIGKYFSDYIGDLYWRVLVQVAPRTVFFPSIGNHDYTDGGGIAAYLNYFTLPGNERYYEFVQGPVHFFAINSDGNAAAMGIPLVQLRLNGYKTSWLHRRLHGRSC